MNPHRHAAFEVLLSTPRFLLIRDRGPWDRHLTVTNDAEHVCERLAPMLQPGQRLLYLDTEGNQDELVLKDGRFSHFAPGSHLNPHETLTTTPS